MMMSLCKKSVHSFLGINTISPMETTAASPLKCQHVVTPLPNGLGLITASVVVRKPTNLLESSSVKSSPTPSPPSSPPQPKKNPGGIGFLDDIGGGVDGLMSCTESLGFESSDERLVDDIQMENMNNIGLNCVDEEDDLCWKMKRLKMRRTRSSRRENEEVKKFPPPLSSLNRCGQPNFYLQPVRKDGRLALMEVRIDRPEILRASRQDGRLILHLIKDDHDEMVQSDCIEEEEVEEEEEEEEAEVKEESEEEEEKEEREEKRVDEYWKFPVSGGEGLRRCHELVNRHNNHHHHHHGNHHNHLHVWSQHCVTTS